jgi:hypothetical protein
MNNLKPNKNIEVPPSTLNNEHPPFSCVCYGHDYEWKVTPLGTYKQEVCKRCKHTGKTETVIKGREWVCESCNWTTIGLLNLGEPNETERWMCHGCIKRLYDNYYQLIMAVGSKFADESRHNTALRYINSMENPSNSPACCNDKIPSLPYRIPQDTPKDDERSYFDKYGN